MQRKPFKIACVYDTETTNIGLGEDTRAFPCLFIFNDIRECSIETYVADNGLEKVSYLRTENEAYQYIEDIIMWGRFNHVTPVICAYNLIFDLKPIIYELNQRYQMETMAQSSTHIYTIDLVDDSGNKLLRFWDTYFLEMRGLAAMGQTCGFHKAVGEWDYSLIRTPETPLTDLELDYAKKDVQVIPAYLRFLLESNPWATEDMFGNTILTKTSLVRQMAKHDIGTLRVEDRQGQKVTLSHYFMAACNSERAPDYESYALRKACFRGGLTFTAARYASTIVPNVVSLDVTSMHHTYINGRFVPVGFKRANLKELENAMWSVIETERSYILDHFDKPFMFGIHGLFHMTNVRLKAGSVFERDHIALLARSKFADQVESGFVGDNELNIAAENAVKESGYKDVAENPVFAFGKLYSADVARVYMTELELWTFAQVYDFDVIKPVFGEVSVNFRRPPDYVMGQSHTLYEAKDALKQILKNYEEGREYKGDISTTIPTELALQIENGNLSKDFLESYYNSTIKGQFNGIYGTQAMDELRPDYFVEQGELYIDPLTKATHQNYDDMKPKSSKTFYNYGSRIVGGSRMHLIMATQLLYEHFGERMLITGGDTDSIKATCDTNVTDEEITKVLLPLKISSYKAIERTGARLRKNCPEIYTDMRGVGGFEIENASPGCTRYPLHFEAWNKARCSLDRDGKAHIIAAGVVRPPGFMNVEELLTELSRKYGFEKIAPLVMGYNTNIDSSISYLLQRHTPESGERFRGEVTDYLGNAVLVDAPQSIALYSTSRDLASIEKRDNRDNLKYLFENFGRVIDTRIKILSKDVGDNPHITILTEEGFLDYEQTF